MNVTPQAFEQQFSLSAIGVMGVVSLIAALMARREFAAPAVGLCA